MRHLACLDGTLVECSGVESVNTSERGSTNNWSMLLVLPWKLGQCGPHISIDNEQWRHSFAWPRVCRKEIGRSCTYPISTVPSYFTAVRMKYRSLLTRVVALAAENNMILAIPRGSTHQLKQIYYATSGTNGNAFRPLKTSEIRKLPSELSRC